MIRTAALLAVAATPLAAADCAEYAALMRAEGVRALVATECVASPDGLPGNWNDVLETPAGACLVSRTISGNPAALGLVAYMQQMNAQRRALGCPTLRVQKQ
jgi:hypothetical protein